MRVYRCISAREITNIYKEKNERLAPVQGENTHKYDKDEKYIHFFRYSQSADGYKENMGIATTSPLDRYVLYIIANIPNEILDRYMGYGIYDSDNFKKRDNNKNNIRLENSGYIPVPEYAIPESIFKKEYIVEVNSFIDYNLKSSEEEYQKYIVLLNLLYEKFKDYKKVTQYLDKENLQQLLRIKDDNRTEEQIREDKVNEIIKVFSNDEFYL